MLDAVADPDPRVHLRGGITGGVHTFAAHRDVVRALTSMAELDPDAVGGAMQRMEEARARGMLRLARRLARHGLLCEGVTAKEAADRLWVLTSFDGFDLPSAASSPTPRRHLPKTLGWMSGVSLDVPRLLRVDACRHNDQGAQLITAAPTTRLSAVMSGRAVAPGDGEWDAARQVFNLLTDQRPEAVAFPIDESDVAAVVNYARKQGLRIAPQSTGHNAAPLGSLDDTIILNTSELTEVSIDAAARRVRVGTGVRWETVTPELSRLGLAALHGSSPDVGIAGYSLGGGMGWLARKHGLQTNSVTAIELVTADGHLVRTDAVHEPDLFWALRGGGGNFGVVTAIEFDVYPVEELYAGAMFFPFERSSEVLHAWRELLPALPDELMSWANLLHFPDLPEVPEPVRGGSFAVVMGAFLGEEADGRELLRPVRALGPAMDTFGVVPPIALGELAMDPRDPLPLLSGHELVSDLPAAAIDDLVAAAGPGSGSRLAMTQLRHMGGALGREAPGAGARATLPGSVSLFALGVVGDEESAAAVEASLEAVTGAVRRHRVGHYPNFVEEAADASAFFEPHAWRGLRAVKARYDAADLFKGNHHIPPSR